MSDTVDTNGDFQISAPQADLRRECGDGKRVLPTTNTITSLRPITEDESAQIFTGKHQRVNWEINLQSAIRENVREFLEWNAPEADCEEIVEDMTEAATDELVRCLLHGVRPRND